MLETLSNRENTPPPPQCLTLPETPTKSTAVRKAHLDVRSHLTAVTSPTTRRVIAHKIEKLANAAQQAMTENGILKQRIVELEAALNQRRSRSKGGRRVLSTATVITGAELLRLREEMDQRDAQAQTGKK